jgi:hypothetical protein
MRVIPGFLAALSVAFAASFAPALAQGVPISGLPAATPLPGSFVPAVVNGVTSKVTVQQLLTTSGVTLTNLPLNQFAPGTLVNGQCVYANSNVSIASAVCSSLFSGSFALLSPGSAQTGFVNLSGSSTLGSLVAGSLSVQGARVSRASGILSFSPLDYGAACDDATDDTAAFNAAIAAAQISGGAVGGGTVVVPAGTPCLILGVLQPVYANSTTTDDDTPIQNPVRITGSGKSISGITALTLGNMAGSVLDMRYAGCRIDNRGNGEFELDHLTLYNGGSSAGKFLCTTNTNLSVHNNTFWGGGVGSGASYDDGIIWGGNGYTVSDASVTAGSNIVAIGAGDPPFDATEARPGLNWSVAVQNAGAADTATYATMALRTAAFATMCSYASGCSSHSIQPNTLTINSGGTGDPPFVASDVGSNVCVNGVGVAGAQVCGIIMSYSDANDVQVSFNATTAVTGATATYGWNKLQINQGGSGDPAISYTFIGANITVIGAGPGGANLTGTITCWADNNDVCLSVNASTAVSGATANYIAPFISTISGFTDAQHVTTTYTPTTTAMNTTAHWAGFFNTQAGAFFQGYGSYAAYNSFSHIRHAHTFYTAANDINIGPETIVADSGSTSEPDGAPYVFQGDQFAFGGGVGTVKIHSGFTESPSGKYNYAVTMRHEASYILFEGLSVADNLTMFAVIHTGDSTANRPLVIPGNIPLPVIPYVDGPGAVTAYVCGPTVSLPCQFPYGVNASGISTLAELSTGTIISAAGLNIQPGDNTLDVYGDTRFRNGSNAVVATIHANSASGAFQVGNGTSYPGTANAGAGGIYYRTDLGALAVSSGSGWTQLAAYTATPSFTTVTTGTVDQTGTNVVSCWLCYGTLGTASVGTLRFGNAAVATTGYTSVGSAGDGTVAGITNNVLGIGNTGTKVLAIDNAGDLGVSGGLYGSTLNGSGSGITAGSIPLASLAADTISGTALGGTLPALTFGAHLSAGTLSSYNGTLAGTIVSDATNLNTASTIVARDASGNFSAGAPTMAGTNITLIPAGQFASASFTSGDCLRASSATAISSAAGDCVTSLTAGANISVGSGTTPSVAVVAAPTFGAVQIGATSGYIATTSGSIVINGASAGGFEVNLNYGNTSTGGLRVYDGGTTNYANLLYNKLAFTGGACTLDWSVTTSSVLTDPCATAFSSTVKGTSSIAAGSGTGATLTAGDLGASRSTTTGAVNIGGSSGSCTIDYGVTTASTLTDPCTTAFTGTTTIGGKKPTFASCTDTSVGVITCSATVAYTSSTTYACGMSYVGPATTTGTATGITVVNASGTSVTGTIVGLSLATGTATLLFNCLGS